MAYNPIIYDYGEIVPTSCPNRWGLLAWFYSTNSDSYSSGRHNMIHRHNMSQWVKTTDLCFKTDSKSVIFNDSSYLVRGSYYVYHWILQAGVGNIYWTQTLDHRFQNTYSIIYDQYPCYLLLGSNIAHP